MRIPAGLFSLLCGVPEHLPRMAVTRSPARRMAGAQTRRAPGAGRIPPRNFPIVPTMARAGASVLSSRPTPAEGLQGCCRRPFRAGRKASSLLRCFFFGALKKFRPVARRVGVFARPASVGRIDEGGKTGGRWTNRWLKDFPGLAFKANAEAELPDGTICLNAAGWAEVSGNYHVPAKATRAVVQLCLQGAPRGRVEWSGLSLMETARTGRTQSGGWGGSVHFRPNGGNAAVVGQLQNFLQPLIAGWRRNRRPTWLYCRRTLTLLRVWGRHMQTCAESFRGHRPIILANSRSSTICTLSPG